MPYINIPPPRYIDLVEPAHTAPPRTPPAPLTLVDPPHIPPPRKPSARGAPPPPAPRRTPLGLLTLVDHLPDPNSGERTTPQQRLFEVIAEAILAEELGFERFAVGEHHFCDYILSNPSL